MSEYRRYYKAGGYYFFTLVTYQRRAIFSNPANIKLFKASMNKVKQKHPFSLNAIVILPDHLHCIWKMPINDNDYSCRWRLIKGYVSKEINTLINHRKEKEIWQRRFWEHYIRDEEDWRKHMDYIHYNPVKHGLVKSPYDWQYSSFHYWVRQGIYNEDWGVSEPILFSNMKNLE